MFSFINIEDLNVYMLTILCDVWTATYIAKIVWTSVYENAEKRSFL